MAEELNVNENAKKRSPKTKRAGSPKRRRAAANKPTTLSMVRAAIAAMKDRKGSSAQGIRKYVMANNRVPANRINSMLRLALTRGVTTGALVRPKGSTATGATGRFRLGKVAAPKKPKKKKAKKPKKKAKKVKKAKKPKKKAPKKKRAAKPKKKARKPAAKKAKRPAKKAVKKTKKAKK